MQSSSPPIRGAATAFPTSPAPGSRRSRATRHSTGCAAKPAGHRRRKRRFGLLTRRDRQWTTTTATTATIGCGCCSPVATRPCRRSRRSPWRCAPSAGLTTVDIARVFLVPEATIGQRISRAKAKIAKAHIPYRVPEAHELPDRLRPVLTTVYAVFTAGHHAPVGELDARLDLADEAIRLARVLVELMPDEAECVGLLALDPGHQCPAQRPHRRRTARSCCSPTRTGRCGTWRRSPRPSALVESVLRRGRPGAYQMQAAIACLHGVGADLRRHGLAADRRAVRPARDALADAGGQSQSSRRRGRGRRTARRPGVARRTGRQARPNDGICTGRPVPTSSAASARRQRPSDSYRQALECPCNDSDRRFLRRRLAELGAAESAPIDGTHLDASWLKSDRSDAR